jgi:uncharacterized protein YndB with AHSA1/START domain
MTTKTAEKTSLGRSQNHEYLHLTKPPVAKTAMLIRRPVAEVFDAFINPEITAKFWFTKSGGRLEVGKPVKWEWEMYNVSTCVDAKVIEPNNRLLIEWDGYSGRTLVEWTFVSHTDDTTFLTITESGWTGDGDQLLGYVADWLQGFAFTLAGLKAVLEHGIQLQLVADAHPS